MRFIIYAEKPNFKLYRQHNLTLEFYNDASPAYRLGYPGRGYYTQAPCHYTLACIETTGMLLHTKYCRARLVLLTSIAFLSKVKSILPVAGRNIPP